MIIGGYRTVREIGQGATGPIYLARKDGREFTLKVLNTKVGRKYRLLHENMKQEIDALKNLNGHKYIVELLDG